MNRTKLLPLSMAGLGLALLALRLGLYALALDEKNLLVRGHPLSWALWAVTALCLGCLFLGAKAAAEGNALCNTKPLTALADGVLALGIALSMLRLSDPASMLEKLRLVFGWAGAAAMVWSAASRARGKTPFFGCSVLVCLFLALHLVASYQLWSSNPQLQDYVFSMAACVAAALHAYQTAALSVGIGSRRVWLASGLAAVAFGLAALCRCQLKPLYLAAALWALIHLLASDFGKGKWEK